MFRRSFVLVLLAGVPLVSCDSPTAPRLLPATVTMLSGAGAPPSPSAIAVADTLRVSGSIGVNEPCYSFTASASADRGALVVTLVATRQAGVCPQVLASFGYVITVPDVPAGTWALHLVYDRHGPPTYTEAVLDTQVFVQ